VLTIQYPVLILNRWAVSTSDWSALDYQLMKFCIFSWAKQDKVQPHVRQFHHPSLSFMNSRSLK